MRVTCVNPGVVESDLASTITHDETASALYASPAIVVRQIDSIPSITQQINAEVSVDTTEITPRSTSSAN